jgi:hypothetical protein
MLTLVTQEACSSSNDYNTNKKKDYKSHLVRRVQGASTMIYTAHIDQIQLKIGDNAQHTATAHDASLNTGIIVSGGFLGWLNKRKHRMRANIISF